MITNALSIQIAVIVLCIAEAWLEDIVIKLKNPALEHYPALNKKEHTRSAIYYSALVVAFTVLTWEAVDHHIWLVLSLLTLRRIFFTYGLKIIRPNKKLRDIEGDSFSDKLLRNVFGKRGGYIELAALLAAVALINKFFLL